MRESTKAASRAKENVPERLSLRLLFALKLAALAVLFAISLLTVVPAPTTLFWMLAIGATEYGHWFFLAPLILLFVGRSNHACRFLAAAACLLFLSPTLRVMILAPKIQSQIHQTFSPLEQPDRPRTAASAFHLPNLWLGTTAARVPAQKLPFAEHDGQKLCLQFYKALSSEPAPCIIVLHTGGWNNGTTEEFLEMNWHLARLGYAVAAVEYRLAPRWQWPAPKEDVEAAMDLLRSQADELGIDPQRFVLLGRSAGGQIATAVAYGSRNPAICGVIAFYAPADMNFAFRYARSDDILDSLKLLKDYLGGTPETQAKKYDSASGYDLVTAQSPPTLLIHGKRDELVWFLQSQRLAARLDANKVKNTFVEIPWATHAFDFNPNGPGGQLSTYALEQFLATVTRR